MTDLEQSRTPFTCARRQVLLGAGLGGVALVATACGSSSSDTSSTPASDGSGASSAPSSSGTTAAPSSAGSSAASGIIALSEVPTDSAVSVKAGGKTLLVTQSGGKLAAYDATCPHQGCTVAPKDSILVCPCHNSEFALTGAVTQGPATTGLTPVTVKDESGQVVLG